MRRRYAHPRMTATAIAFDFNGTLSNDEPVLLAVYQELFAELGHPLTEAEYYDHLAGHTDEEMFSRWLGHADPALIADRVERYIARVSDGSTVDEEARAAVRFAAARVPVAHRLGGDSQRDRRSRRRGRDPRFDHVDRRAGRRAAGQASPRVLSHCCAPARRRARRPARLRGHRRRLGRGEGRRRPCRRADADGRRRAPGSARTSWSSASTSPLLERLLCS